MNDRDRVGGAQRVGGLGHDPPDLVHRQLAPAADPGGHRLAVDVSHDEVDQPQPFADGVDGDDVGMAQAGRGLGLAGEPLADVLLEGKLGREHLDGDPALEPLVASAVHHAHAAPADLALDGVGVSQGRGEAGRKGLVSGAGHGVEAAGPACAKLPCPLEMQPDMADNLYRREPCRYS